MALQDPCTQHLLHLHDAPHKHGIDVITWAAAGTVLGLVVCLLTAGAGATPSLFAATVTRHTQLQPRVGHSKAAVHLRPPAAAASRGRRMQSATSAGPRTPGHSEHPLLFEVPGAADPAPLWGRIPLVVCGAAAAAAAVAALLWQAATGRRRGWDGPLRPVAGRGGPLATPAPSALAMFTAGASKAGYASCPLPLALWNAALDEDH